ncbi:hypothetical protein GBA52_005058 [Prunus armeniaca]|nr:hypothetical protein GBA52_005058 [Prunus armeniaca]
MKHVISIPKHEKQKKQVISISTNKYERMRDSAFPKPKIRTRVVLCMAVTLACHYVGHCDFLSFLFFKSLVGNLTVNKFIIFSDFNNLCACPILADKITTTSSSIIKWLRFNVNSEEQSYIEMIRMKLKL